jgi:DNA-binding transcriptional ArsR family regulator
MGITKKEIHDPNIVMIADMLDAISHPARLTILKLLKNRSLTNGEIVGLIGLSQATISQHLKILGEHGLITGTHIGTSIIYKLHSELWKRVTENFISFI